jgi:hypothetical protein
VPVPLPPRPPIPPGICKVEYAGTFLGHQWKNIAYAALGGTGIGSADLNTMAGTINTSWGTRFIASLSDQCQLNSVKLTHIPSVGNEVIGISTVAKIGARAGGFVDNSSSCMLINWNVNKYYRGGHPRWYIASVETADVTNGSLLSGGMRTQMTTAANGHLNDVNAITTSNITAVTLGTLSWVHNKAWRVPPVHFPYITASVGATIATQRRRIHS